MENNWSPPSFKWTVSHISLNVIARWIRGSASLAWKSLCSVTLQSGLSECPQHLDLCPSGVHNTSWKKWGNGGDKKWGVRNDPGSQRGQGMLTTRHSNPLAHSVSAESSAGNGQATGSQVYLPVALRNMAGAGERELALSSPPLFSSACLLPP